MSSVIKVLAPGRYVGKFFCKDNCEIACHHDNDKKHYSINIHYHVPFAGVITVQAHSEKEADLRARTLIYEALTKIYVETMKTSIEIEKLLKEVY